MSPAHPLRGIALFSFALLLFACMDTTIKWLSASYPVPLIVAVRYTVHCALMLLLVTPRIGARALFGTTRAGLVALRGVALAGASLCAGLAFKRMPVAETTAIFFLSPVVVVLLAGPLLGETIARAGWIAALLGFGGVILIAQPGAGLDPVGVAFALGAMCMTTTYQLLSRVLVRTERVLTLLFYTALVGAVAFGTVAPFFLEGPRPGALQVAAFLFTGAAGGVGHYFFTAAHANAPASTLAPMLYIQLVWASLLGWIVFDHLPHGLAFLGMVVVTGAGVLVATASRKPPEPAEP